MGNILDLRVFDEETLDIVMANGDVLHIPKPSERMIIRIMRAKNIDENSDPAEAEAVLNELTWRVLDSNLDGRSFDRASVERMTQQVRLAILNAYAEFARKFQENPT